MSVTRLLLRALVLVAVACSGDEGVASLGEGGAGAAGTDATIVPERLAVTALAGGNGVLDIRALTLRQGPSGAEIYAAVRNTGDRHACSAALAVELFDESGRSLAAGVGGLLAQRFYRLTDGSGAIAACIGPGDVGMAAISELPGDLAIDDVATILYRCPYFALEVVPIDGPAIAELTSVARDTGTAYKGTLVNGFGVALRDPAVTVFAVDRAGRPLGVATGRGSGEIPPGGRWEFETSAVDAPATDHAAYPTGAIVE